MKEERKKKDIILKIVINYVRSLLPFLLSHRFCSFCQATFSEDSFNHLRVYIHYGNAILFSMEDTNQPKLPKNFMKMKEIGPRGGG